MGKLIYDPIEHAKDIVFNGGSCDGSVGCQRCFAIKCGDNCYPDDAYAAAKEYLKKHKGQDRCVSIW